VVNCASLPESLLESELFGHVRGAFTGAERDKPGLIRSAGAGTIFLDEVDKASASFQANLLHVLDRREIRAVGSHTFHEVRARFVLATNRDLPSLAAQGDFLADLEYRISGLRVDVPALRERIDDFDLLLALALRELRLAENITKGITTEARNFLSSYDWPGNLRELFSVIAAAGLLADEDASISMPEILRVFRDSRREIHVQRASRSGSLASRMEGLEKEELMLTLRLEGGSQSRAAEKLGITRRGLNKKLHRFGLIEQLDRESLADFSTRKKETTEDVSAGDDLDC
jgi:transcriptional regulator with PAS, ATPase and Fis domain